MTHPKLNGRQARWKDLLAKFHFNLEYRSGKTNHVVDALSQRADLASVCLLATLRGSKVTTTIKDQIRDLLIKDLVTQYLVDLVGHGKTRQFYTEDGFLKVKGNRLYVPKRGDMRRTLLAECHDTLWVGHLVEERTMALLRRAYYWHQMIDDVAPYVKTCLTERFNGMLEEYLRYFVTGLQKNWVKLLDAAQLCFNSQKSSSTNKNAFEIITRQQPLLPHTVNAPNMSKSPQVASFSKEWKRNLEIVRSYLVKAPKRMKRRQSDGRNPKRYLFAGVHDSRLLQKYIGLLSIERRIGKVAYWVDTPAWWKIHPVFHVNLLKPFWEDMEDPSRSQLTLPSIRGPNLTEKRRVEAILDDRVIHASRKDHQDFLVKW
ncbi:uncharacterized protein [Nicotiana tomentosiformis]|uniref:uncharacterized protein n=1 Tax=Nicotiana tomentosiformis TaxID=4098 RepID=UPI00388C7249